MENTEQTREAAMWLRRLDAVEVFSAEWFALMAELVAWRREWEFFTRQEG
jgi:hypothetical protein